MVYKSVGHHDTQHNNKKKLTPSMTTLEAYAERRNYVHYGECRLWWLETVISI